MVAEPFRDDVRAGLISLSNEVSREIAAAIALAALEGAAQAFRALTTDRPKAEIDAVLTGSIGLQPDEAIASLRARAN